MQLPDNETARMRSAHSADCVPISMRFLTNGAGPAWSHSGNDLIAYMQRGSSNRFEVFWIRPDGSGQRCLTCNLSDGPPAKVHKGTPTWHASGRYIVFQAEMDKHIGPGWLAEPGRGWWNDLWALDVESDRFTRLTRYDPRGVGGVLVPRLSKRGDRLVWSKLIATPRDKRMKSGVFGRWEINVADFRTSGGEPRLDNIRNVTPPGGIFYEAQDWSPDDSRILFAADIGRSNPYAMDIFSFDVARQDLRRLTDTGDEWDEQASYSNSGRKIVFMSSMNNPEFDSRKLNTLRTELFLADADGGNPVQLTHFNTPGYPEYDSDRSAATKAAWSPDGSMLAAEQLMTGRGYNTRNRSRTYIVTFAGRCGTQ
jgi:Tol biopolymer transport system component